MSKLKDLTGQRFGRLTVIERAENNKHGQSRWKCRCDCGNEIVTLGKDLRKERTQSCSCLRRDRTSEACLENLVGQKFGRFTVLSRAENKGKQTCWLCRCDCGSEVVVAANNLKNGKSKSCGCWNSEKSAEFHTKHGMCGTKVYHTWFAMKSRCLNPNNAAYKNYGGRGITIYPSWIDDFQSFYDYVSKLEHFGEDGYSLDRIDVNGNYEPDNIRWATTKEQANNKRNNIIVEYNGKSMAIKEAAEKSGLSITTLKNRLKAGDTGERLFRPSRQSS